MFNRNSLTGTLPTEIGLLSDLKALGVKRFDEIHLSVASYKSGLQGQLPSEIGQLESLGE